MNIKIKNLQSDGMKSWDTYVENHPNTSFFHKSGWKNILEKSFSHKTYYLFAEDLDTHSIVGVLPLANINSFFFGNSLVSVPFCVYGGCIADSEEISSLLLDESIRLSRKLGVDYLELRNREIDNNLPTKDLYVTFRKNISQDQDENMKAIPRKQRAMVRKGIKSGLVTEFDTNVERFFNIYSISVRNHGTPVFPKNFFVNIKDEFGDDCEIRVVTKDKSPISTVMSFYYKNEVLPYYGGGIPEARSYKAFDFMYWEIMKDAPLRGVEIFDYGRSKKGTGSYSFKKNWGFSPENLKYQYYLLKTDKIPEVNPLNPKYQLFIKVWKKLPVQLANVVGPFLAKDLG